MSGLSAICKATLAEYEDSASPASHIPYATHFVQLVEATCNKYVTIETQRELRDNRGVSALGSQCERFGVIEAQEWIIFCNRSTNSAHADDKKAGKLCNGNRVCF